MNQGRCCICEVVFPSRMSLLERSEHVQNCLSKDHVQISVCWICQVDMAGFTAKGQEEHMEECFARRGCKESAEVYRNQQCPICGLNLLLFPESERLLHAEECLEEGVGSCGKFEDSEFIEESVPKNQTWRELAMPQLSDSKFKCFNCSKDLSKHGIKQRMMHMKKCSNLEESSLELIFNFSQSEQPASSMTASRGNSKNSPQHVVTSIKLALSRIEEQISSLQNAKVSLQRRLDRAQSLLASTSSNAEEMDVPSTPSNHQQSMSDGNELEDKNYVSVTQNFKKSALKERRKKDRSLWSLSERTEEESGNNPQSTNTTDYNDSKELSSCSSKESSGSIKRRCKGQKNDSFLSTSIMPDFSSLSESELKVGHSSHFICIS